MTFIDDGQICNFKYNDWQRLVTKYAEANHFMEAEFVLNARVPLLQPTVSIN